MENLLLEALGRVETGSAHCRRIRRKGLIPGNIYGHKQSYNVTFNSHAFEMLRHKMHSEHAVIKIKLDDNDLNVLIKDIHRHQVTHKIIHIDFLLVDLEEIIKISVQIDAIGEPDGVKNHGGILEIIRRDVEVECKANNIPNSITVDTSALGIHDAIRVKDLPEIEGVSYCDDLELTVVTVAAPTVEEEETETEEEAVEPEVIGAKDKEEE